MSNGFDVRGRALQEGELAAWLSEHSLGNRFAVAVVGTEAGHGATAVALAIVAADGDGRYLDPAALAPDDEQALASWLADPGPPKALHDAKAAMHALAGRGWTLRGVATDTALAAHLLRPEQRELTLNHLLVHHMRCALPAEAAEISDYQRFSRATDPDGHDEPTVQPLILRACAVLDLADVLDEELARIDSSALLSRVELPAQRALAAMEMAGIAVDHAKLAGIRRRLAQDPAAAALTAAVDGVLNSVAADGRIHTTFCQIGAATGRIVSVDPALDSAAIPADDTRRIRDAFGAGDGYTELMTARYTRLSRTMADKLADEVIDGPGPAGYANTLLGRRLYLHDSGDATREAERAAQFRIQGSAADTLKMAMIKVSQAIENAGLMSRMVLQVDDELVFEVAAGERDALATLVREQMAEAVSLEVPLEVALGFGSSWGTAGS